MSAIDKRNAGLIDRHTFQNPLEFGIGNMHVIILKSGMFGFQGPAVHGDFSNRAVDGRYDLVDCIAIAKGPGCVNGYIKQEVKIG